MAKEKWPSSGRPGGQREGAEDEAAGPVDAYERIAADRTLQLEICCTLESLADSLPEVDLNLARALAGVLEPSWIEHVSFQDEVLFPILSRDVERALLVARLDTLKREHTEISGRFGELNEQIVLVIEGEAHNADAFGYLVRGVFESLRSHIDHEAVLLEEFMPRVLSPADRKIVETWSASRAWPPFPISLLSHLRS
jgi:hypothetical protein